MEIKSNLKIDHLKLRGVVFASGKKVKDIATEAQIDRIKVSRLINGKFSTKQSFLAVCRVLKRDPSEFEIHTRETVPA